MHAALVRAKALGLRRVEVEVSEENHPDIGLYKSVGVKVEGRKIEAVRTGDRCINAFVMALLLRDYPVDT